MIRDAPRRLHADSFACGLHERTLGGLVDLGPGSARFLLVSTGEVVVAGPSGDAVPRGPAIGWFPDAAEQRLRARAGSAGRTLVLSDLALAAVTRHAAPAVRDIARRRAIHTLAGASELGADVEHALAVILREAKGGRPGADALVAAQVGILLLLLWRHAGAAAEQRGTVPDPLLADFRRLLELHFRDRWSVASYAEGLGVSPDLLHDRCTRRLGRSPSALIRERVVQEARTLLAGTPLSAARIAAELGFDQPAHFSRVFSAATGLPPGALPHPRPRRRRDRERPQLRRLAMTRRALRVWTVLHRTESLHHN